LLLRFPQEYLYGCIGADITFGKRYTRAMEAHCHTWQVGWQVLGAAETDAQRAFGYGYLTHLAADVYSHNHFVPTQLVVSFRGRALGHAYWEACFDTLQDPAYRRLLRDVRRPPLLECDQLFKRAVARTIFSFRTNKRIFDSALAFQGSQNWHQMIQQVSRRPRYGLERELIDRYNTVCVESILDVLRHGKKARCQSPDPAGLESLSLAKDVRRALKTLRRRGRMTPELARRIESLNSRFDLDGQPAAPGSVVAPG
jgi:hypothetical protein